MDSGLAAVVILSWNHKEHTLSCLKSVFAQTYERRLVILVDNGSTDDTIAAVAARFPDCHVVPNGRNLGYAEGNNVGIREALRAKADFVLILNNDTILDPSAISALVQEAERSPDIGILGPALSHPPEPMGISFWDNFFWRRSHADLLDISRINRPTDVSMVLGCCMLIKRFVFEKVGLLDAAFFAYDEEHDFCVRARKAGFRVLYIPRLLVHHALAGSTGGMMSDSPLKSYLLGRNHVFFNRKHATWLQWIKFLCWVPLKCLTLTAGCWLRPNRTAAFAKIRGFYDGFSQCLDAWPSFPRWICRTDAEGLPIDDGIG